MRKISEIIFSISGMSILFVLLLLCFISPMKSVNSEDISTKSVNWMSNLKGSTFIRDINIPGTHDSGTKLTAG